MIRSGLSAFALALFLGAAQSSAVTLDFNDQTCDSPVADFTRTVGNVTYDDPNIYSYDDCGPEIVIGDDGFFDRAAIRAEPGYRFDLLSFDIDARSDVRRMLYDPAADPFEVEQALFNDSSLRVEEFAIFELTGFRQGLQVAQLTLSAFTGLVTPGAAFTDLDRLLFRQTAYGYNTFIDGRFIYGCGSGGDSCGNISYDNVALDVYPTGPAPVPLPATGLLLVAGLAALALGRRRRT